MANTSGTSSAPPGEPATYEQFHEQVRRRAYELYEQRGGEHGHDLDDWLQARSELLPPGFKVELLANGVKLVTA